MRIISVLGRKSLERNTVVLFLAGVAAIAYGVVAQNPATVVLGSAFAALTLACYVLIIQKKAFYARLCWALFTPIILFLPPVFFPVSQPSSLVTYGYFYTTGLVFAIYYLQERNEQWLKWLSISLFFVGLMLYDRVMVWRNFSGAPTESLYLAHAGYLKAGQCIHFIMLVFLVLLAQENKLVVQEALASNVRKLASFTNLALAFGKNKAVSCGDLHTSLAEILKEASQAIDVSRISIWEYDAKAELIRAVVVRQEGENTPEAPSVLHRKDYPIYFARLLQERILSVPDAATHPDTQEFCKGYLSQLGIYSMLDSPFFVHGAFRGIVCFEEQRRRRQWDEVEEYFSTALSKLVSIAYYTSLIQDQMDQLRQKNQLLDGQNRDLQEVNKRVRDLNGDLVGQLAQERTALEEISTFLQELPFKNAHEIRGPLTRILALVYHCRSDPSPENHAFSLQHIEAAATEMDEIVKGIAEILDKRESDLRQPGGLAP